MPTAPPALRPHGFRPNTSPTLADLPYQYDHNGNMILDPHKELKISYNFLNLPRLMSKHGQAVLATVYDATGRKWRAVRSIQPLGQDNQPIGQHQIETTTYLGGVEWKQAGGEPTRLHAVNASAHGRTAFTVDEATGETRSRLEYYHTDHLGNVRLAFSDLDGNGTITVGDIYAPDNEVVMEQHYYPFGLSQNGPGSPPSTPTTPTGTTARSWTRRRECMTTGLGIMTRRLRGGGRWSSGISNRRTTPIASGEIGDSEYNSSDNLYSSGSTTLTAYQISIANSNAVEKNYQNGRGIVHGTKGGSPARTTHYRVRGGKVAGLKFYGKSTRNDMKTHILTKRLH